MYQDKNAIKVSSLEDELLNKIYDHGDDNYAIEILMALRNKIRSRIEKEIEFNKSQIEKSYLLLEKL